MGKLMLTAFFRENPRQLFCQDLSVLKQSSACHAARRRAVVEKQIYRSP
jgi:hypothetical protein